MDKIGDRRDLSETNQYWLVRDVWMLSQVSLAIYIKLIMITLNTFKSLYHHPHLHSLHHHPRLHHKCPLDLL